LKRRLSPSKINARGLEQQNEEKRLEETRARKREIQELKEEYHAKEKVLEDTNKALEVRAVAAENPLSHVRGQFKGKSKDTKQTVEYYDAKTLYENLAKRGGAIRNMLDRRLETHAIRPL